MSSDVFALERIKMATQSELIRRWEKEANYLIEQLKADHYLSNEDRKSYLEKAEVLRDCANELKALTYI